MPLRSLSRRPQGLLHQNPNAVRQARLARKIKQSALAKRASISPSYLSEIETGWRSAPPETLRRIARALRIDVTLLERVRPYRCSECDFRFDVLTDDLVPLHTDPRGSGWCPGGQRPRYVEVRAA